MSDFAAVTDPKLKLEGMIRDLRAFNPKKVTWEEGDLRNDVADELERIIQQHYGGEPKPANKYPWPLQDPARFNINSADRWIEICLGPLKLCQSEVSFGGYWGGKETLLGRGHTASFAGDC